MLGPEPNLTGDWHFVTEASPKGDRLFWGISGVKRLGRPVARLVFIDHDTALYIAAMKLGGVETIEFLLSSRNPPLY